MEFSKFCRTSGIPIRVMQRNLLNICRSCAGIFLKIGRKEEWRKRWWRRRQIWFHQAALGRRLRKAGETPAETPKLQKPKAAAAAAAAAWVERFDRRGTEPFEPFEPFEFFQNRNFLEFFLRKFKNFRKFQHFLNYRRNSDKISSKSEQKSA